MVIRTPDQRLRVFVSSTLKELATERAAARQAIERLRLIPVLFEVAARPHAPRSLYQAYLEQSHVFIGIYWQEYGWIAPGAEISGLEDEYLLAGAKPKLIYLRDPAPNRDPRLATMIAHLRADNVSYKRFSTADELAALIQDDLALMLSERFEGSQQVSGNASETRQRSYLPIPTSRFIGRRKEMEALHRLLGDDGIRLLTLTGPGGIGKTRLALQFAAASQSQFDDGVALVTLAPVVDSAMVAQTIAAALGVSEASNRAPLETLKEYLRHRHMLLVLDNFEHLVGGAPVVMDLLEAGERLRVLATSREALRLSGEHTFEVPPLVLPERADHSAEALGSSEAVELFVDRANALRHDFVLTERNAPVIAEICRRLDGLPLAIEFAAARVRMFSPEAILRRLDKRLALLTSGPRDLPERHRTLRHTIQWSYDLLAETDKKLFERLGVFAAGCTLSAAEAICGDAGAPDTIDGLSSLVDKSLVRCYGPPAGEPRFAMLETVREFALERLLERGDAERIRRVHADFFLALAEEGEPRLRTGEHGPWSERLAVEVDNLRAAMRWALDHGEPNLAARMAWALWLFWWDRSLMTEAVPWMEEVLATSNQLSPKGHARATLVLGIATFWRGDYQRAIPNLRQAQLLCRQLGDLHGMATALVPLGVATALTEGAKQGEDLLRQALDTFNGMDETWGATYARLGLGRVLHLEGRDSEAVPVLQESVAGARVAGPQVLLGQCLLSLGWARLALENFDHAKEAFLESLKLFASIGNGEGTARALEACAALAAAHGLPEHGALFFGAAEGVRQSVGAIVWIPDQPSHDRTERLLRAALGPEYEARLLKGIKLPLQEVLDSASGL